MCWCDAAALADELNAFYVSDLKDRVGNFSYYKMLFYLSFSA